MTCSQRPRRLLGFRRGVAPVASALIVALVCSGLVPSVRAGDRHAGPPYDAAVLSEIAEDVLRRESMGAKPSPVPISPDATTAAAAAAYTMEGEGIELAPDSPFTNIAPAREGITVPTPPGVAAPGKVKLDTPPVGYHSNSWRQGNRHSVPALSFSSGVLAPSSGLDAALQAQGVAVAAQGRPFVYGFVLLTVPRDKALEQQLAGLGVHLLGPHDDHHKARLPVGSLAGLATMPEVAWLGVSPPEQKLSAELAAQRGPQGEKAGVGPETPIPIVINLFEGDDKGTFRRELEAVGAALGKYDPELASYRAVATGPTIEKIAGLDFVLFVELIGTTSPGHDQSTPLIDADIIRPGTPLGHTRFSAATVTVGVLDSGFEMGAGGHVDLNKFGCGMNFTDEAGGPFEDPYGHGTHVLGTIAGTGTGNPRYRGVATGLGSIDRIRVAKIWRTQGNDPESWMEDAMDFMSQPSACGSVAPELINISGGHHAVGEKGTDTLSRKLDGKVWTYGQAYVVCSGNEGPLSRSIRRPGVAKNALTVGQVFDWGYGQVGDISPYSSQGPTGDGRMKPNLVAPGASVTSAKAGTSNEYLEQGGCSMATPHVTGLAATLMDHYPDFRGRPALLRAHLMATAIGHEDSVEMSNLYGLGRTSGYLAHWDHPNSAGWQTFKFWGGVSSQGFQYNDITVPPNTKRLIVVLTWDEPPASAGASRAVTYDLDLWIDHEATCGFIGDCGDYQSVSFVDNVEYIVVDNPPPGLYRLKAHPWNAPTFNLRYGMVARIIRGDPTPAMAASLTAPSDPKVGSTFTVTLNVNTPSYVVSGAQVELTSSTPPGLTFLGFNTRRHDGVDTGSGDPEGEMTLGNLVPMLGRSATWTYRADSPGPKTFAARVWSENGGEVIATATVNVVSGTSNADLVQTAMTTNPPAPIRAPGTTFSVTDTVQNAGTARSGPSTTRYYLSLDAVKSEDDTLLTGSHSAHGLDPGASHSTTVTVTIPTATPPNAYFLIACADDQNAVVESNESNNCIASPGAIVAVARPDLVEATATTNPPAPIRAPGTTFSVTDTVQNLGPAPSGSSTTRYYLSLDGAKSAGDTLLNGSRALPGLASGSTHTGTVTVTIPAATPLNIYFLLACADDLSKVMETAEGNNCTTSAAATVTVTRPDLLENTVSAPPATKQRGTSFTITDTVQNIGAVASGPSVTRYYLSLDAVKGAGDALLTGSRTVPALAAEASHSGAATVTIPAATPLNTYFLLACADAPNTVVEANEANNCKASGTTVTVTP